MKLKQSVNQLSVLVLVFNCIQLSLQLPELDKVSGLEVSSDSKVSGYDKSHGSHKKADSSGWKNLKSSSKGKLDKGKQDEEMFIGEGKHKAKKVNGFHSESGKHKSEDKGLKKDWNRGDGIMKTWNWNKGGHSEEEEGGKWKSNLNHSKNKGKKMGHSNAMEGDAGGSNWESSHKKMGSSEGSKKKKELKKGQKKMSEQWKSDSGKSSSKMDKKMDEMKFKEYEHPSMKSGWKESKKSSHPFGYKGVDHGSKHGGRLSLPDHGYHKGKKEFLDDHDDHDDKFDSLDEKLEKSIDEHTPDELKSLTNMEP